MPRTTGSKEETVPAMRAPAVQRDNPLTRSMVGMAGIAFLTVMICACVLTLPWTLGAAHGQEGAAVPRYNAGQPREGRLPPSWWPADASQRERADVVEAATGTRPSYFLGTDVLGRSLFVRILTGGGISLGIGIAAAAISVIIGTIYGGLAGYVGGKTDAVLMRIVDILYGLPYILLVVLIAVASDALIEGWITNNNNHSITESQRLLLDVGTLLLAIGGVSWLTMARVIRGQVLSLKEQPFIEAARATGAAPLRIFLRHLLPNLLGPIIVYATLTVPQAILQESFLSFLGIGVKPPLPSWGNLAADGLAELNTYRSHWWLLLFPCLLLGLTLLALNFVGEGLREAFDPKRARR